MHSLASRSARRALVAVLALSGCATVQPPTVSGRMSAAQRYVQLQDSLARANGAEESELMSAPRIRLVVPPPTYASTRYVEATFHLSADAYVLVVAVDLDRRLRVLYPETPGASGFAARDGSHRLTRFFAGFGGHTAGYNRFDARYDISQRISPFGGGGVLLAIASDRPLQLDRLVGQDGEWDERMLGQLVFDKTLPSAAQALGYAVALTGQEFNTDYTSFEGRRAPGASSTFASNSFGDCGAEYGYRYGYNSGGSGSDFGYGGVPRFVGFYEQGGVRFARYVSGGSACSAPVFYDVPLSAPRLLPPDTTRHDSARAGQRPPRFPGAPRFPSVSEEGSRVVHRFAPRDARDSARERPLVAAGLRFRPPEQMPADAIRPLDRMTPHDPSGFPFRREPASGDAQRMHPRETRGSEPSFTRPMDREVRERQEPRNEPRAEPAPVERMRPEPRPEPTRPEPTRPEPTRRSEPASREPVHQPAPPINPR